MAENKNISTIIAIDGPAGSGKSTTARLVAQRLGFSFLDTGAMYRAFALKAIRSRVDLSNEAELLHLTKSTQIQLLEKYGGQQVWLDGENVTRAIRRREVSRLVAPIAVFPGVRQWMVKLQRQFAAAGKVVAEGRDVGTVIFPNARLKIFLVASLEERAKRRLKDYHADNKETELRQIMEQIQARDLLDSTREISPLKKAGDAVEIDTTHLSIEEQVELILREWQKVTAGDSRA